MIRKVFISMAILFGALTTVLADDDKPVTINQLPTKAKSFITEYFSNEKVALAKEEKDFWNSTFEVIFVNGNKLEFDNKGNWTEVNCKYSSVPEKIVPSAIMSYIKKNYPDCKVLTIEIEKNRTEVKLSNRVEVTFNKNNEVIDIDMD